MDAPASNAVQLIEALAATIDRLRTFGYSRYSKTRLPGWGNPHHIHCSGSPFRIHHGESIDEFVRTLGCGLTFRNAGDSRRIVFGVDLRYDPTRIFVQATVEAEDDDAEQMSESLWESREWQCDTLQDAIHALSLATDELIQCVELPEIDAVLKRLKVPEA